MNDEQAIRDLVATWMSATKSGDTETVLDLMTDDAVFLVPGKPPFGKREFAQGAQAQSQASLQFDGRSEIQEIQVLGDWAFNAFATHGNGDAAGAGAGRALGLHAHRVAQGRRPLAVGARCESAGRAGFAMNVRLRPALLALVLCASAGCASLQAPRCAAEAKPMIEETLYFGTQTPDSPVSPEQWQAFLATEVTPRFPQGLSVWPASGQWQSADGSITREASYVLTLLHADDAASDTAVRAIAEAYKQRFRQEAVMRVRETACVSF